MSLKSMSAGLQLFDGFGCPVGLMFEQRSHHRTALGGAVSLVLLVVGFIYMYLQVYMMVCRVNPHVQIAYLRDDDPQAYSPELLAVSGQVTVLQCQQEGQKEQCTEVTLEPCFDDRIQEYLCPGQQLVLEGSTRSTVFRWIEVRVDGEYNDTQDTFTLLFSDSQTDLSQPNNPYSYLTSAVRSSLRKGRQLELTLQPKRTVSDNGYIFTSNTAYYAVQQSQLRESIGNEDLLLHLRIQLDCNTERSTRHYLKLHDIIASLGGFWFALSILGRAIVLPLNRLQLHIEMVNSVYTFEPLDSTTTANDAPSSPCPRVKGSRYLWLLCRRIKQPQVQLALRNIRSEMDLSQILTRLAQLDRLKALLLNQDQVALFEYLPRKCIPREPTNKYELLVTNENRLCPIFEKSRYQRSNEALEAYNRLVTKPQRTALDSQLLRFLDAGVKRDFELARETAKQAKLKITPSIIITPHEQSSYEDDMEERSEQAKIDSDNLGYMTKRDTIRRDI